jgi:hypothetical protein
MLLLSLTRLYHALAAAGNDTLSNESEVSLAVIYDQCDQVLLVLSQLITSVATYIQACCRQRVQKQPVAPLLPPTFELEKLSTMLTRHLLSARRKCPKPDRNRPTGWQTGSSCRSHRV